ncbi:MAG: hypothetical protein V1664_02680 [Candidatus Uhrbacteria bacterium]
MNKKLIVKFFQIVIILIPVGLFFWLLNIQLVPSGIFVVERIVNERSPFIDRMLPDARVEAVYQESDGDWVQKIIGDPAFFFVHPQRSFEIVEAEIKFKNTNTPIVELGVLADPTTGAYTLEPLQNLIIDNSTWFKIEKDGTILLQREQKFSSIEDFLAELPPREQIATYHYGLAKPYRLANYQPTDSEQTLEVSLRGSHEFYTYLKNEKLNFIFSYSDINQKIGEDTLTLVAINETGQAVAEIKAQDDGDASADNKISASKELILSADNLPEGVYKIQMKASDDIIFPTIKTRQQKITFLNQVWLADNTDSGQQQIWTEGKDLRLVTHQADGAQILTIDQKKLSIIEPFVEYLFSSATTGLVSLTTERSADLLIKASGHLAFSENQYFNPDPVRLLANTDLDRLGVNYIIANYTPPIKDGEWWVAKAKFKMGQAAFTEKTWKFVLSLPTVEQSDQEFILHSIKMTFLDQPLGFKDLLNKIWTYVFPSP